MKWPKDAEFVCSMVGKSPFFQARIHAGDLDLLEYLQVFAFYEDDAKWWILDLVGRTSDSDRRTKFFLCRSAVR